MPDPDFEMGGEGGGGGRGEGRWSSTPLHKGWGAGLPKQFFLALRASVWFKNKGERAPPLDPHYPINHE